MSSRACSLFLLVLVGCGGDPPPPAGSLVSMSMDAQVGVLLDELPPEARDRAAAEILARPAEYWQASARRQLVTLHLRLTFRRILAVLMSQRKEQLPLPPEESWRITLETPERTTIQGHDYVAVRYHFEGVLLSDLESPAISEPALGRIGGVWDEPFVLPVDPEQLLARTKGACLRPSPSADPHEVEAALTHYDFSCEANGDPWPIGCHAAPAAEDCQASLAAHVGSVSTQLHCERLPWDARLADSVRSGVPQVASGADLAVRTEGLERNYVDYVFVRADSCMLAEQCVSGTGWRRVLKFNASLANVGATALHIGAVSESPLTAHHVYEYSPCHQHSHFRFYGDFAFESGDGLTGDKRSFCLLSTTRYANHEGSPLHADYDNCFYQGIAPGWGDDYFAGLDCQWIDVTDVPAAAGPTVAPLTFKANPASFLCEGSPVLDEQGQLTFEPTEYTTDDGLPIDRPVCDFIPGYQDNDFGSASVSLPPRGSTVTEPCTRGQIGPARDCGFAEQASLACRRGAAATVTCSAPPGSAGQLVRLCEHSQRLGGGVPCTAPTALAYGVVGQSGTVTLPITCPAERDDAEPGGMFTVYASPIFADDPPATLTCTVP